jgi:hypothetical protein
MFFIFFFFQPSSFTPCEFGSLFLPISSLHLAHLPLRRMSSPLWILFSSVCVHPTHDSFCRGCWQRHFQAQLSKGLVDTVRTGCQSHGCPVILDKFSAAQALKPVHFAAYQKALLKHFIDCNPGAHWYVG